MIKITHQTFYLLLLISLTACSDPQQQLAQLPDDAIILAFGDSTLLAIATELVFELVERLVLPGHLRVDVAG